MAPHAHEPAADTGNEQERNGRDEHVDDVVIAAAGATDELVAAARVLRSSAEVVASAMVAAWQKRMRPAQTGPLHRV